MGAVTESRLDSKAIVTVSWGHSDMNAILAVSGLIHCLNEMFLRP